MTESLSRWGVGIWLLAWLGCGDAPAEGTVAARSQSLGLRAGPEAAAEPDEGSDEDPEGCNCISFPPAAPASCPAERLFCNSALDCRCEPESPAGVAQSAAASLAQPRAAQSRRLIREAHDSGEQLATLPRPPLPCVCLAGTPSPPEGGCPEEDWYCNRSGNCQCDS